MSKLDELIKELCPDGVEWKKISNICNISRGIVISKDDIRNNIGEYPVYSSQTGNNGELGKISTFTYEGEYLTWTTDGANAGTVFYRTGKFNVTNVCGLLKITKSGYLSRYIYHVLRVEAPKYVRSGMGNPKLMSNVMGDIQIPIPPLPIQEEIVRILDTFTELTAELTAELTDRKKQYEYYRDSLLTFGDDVEWKALGELSEYSKTRISSEFLDEKNYVGVDNLLQDKLGKTESNHVPTTGNSTAYSINDILIGNIRPYLKKIWYADCVGGTNGDVLVIHLTDESINPKYLYQVLADDNFFEYNMQHAKGAKMPRGNKKMIMEYQIPIPYPNDITKSLAEQQRIVDILDRFDTLCNDISSGLPAEIEERKQQYEYYRDKLLTFPKKEA